MNQNTIQRLNVKFHSLYEFLDFISKNDLEIVQALRGIIHEGIPDCIGKLSYNVPAFYRHVRLCFVWPPSVAWGNV